MSHLDKHSLLSPLQHGFRKGLSCESQLILTLHDLTSNFDSVPHQRLLLKLASYGICGQTLTWIKSFLTDRTQTTVIGGCQSEVCSVTSGVPQGSVLGPLLFLVYINDLPDNISSQIRLFADDCIIYLGLSSSKSPEQLQSDLDSRSSRAEKWQMRFNCSKCYSMHLTRNKSAVVTTYFLNGQALERTDAHPYLGVTISSDLRLNNHCDFVVKKSSKTLNFISRNFYHCTRETKAKLYPSLVRPSLEYACCAWDPYTQRNISNLEKVQRRAARFGFRDYSRNSSVSYMLNVLDWPLLSVSRECQRLNFMYKSSHNLNGVDLSKYVTLSQSQTRRSHDMVFNHLSPRTDVFKFSFFPRTIPVWNSLP